MPGVVAAGHELTAAAGAGVLRDGGNAVDAAVAAVLASCVCEPALTGLGAGGYMLIALPGREPLLLDFFVAAAGRGAEGRRHAELIPIEVSFGDAVQVFNVGPASVGAYGVPAGLAAAVERFGTMSLARLAWPAIGYARDGAPVAPQQAYVLEILAPIIATTPEAMALLAPGGTVLRAGEVLRQPELADALERLAADGPAPFYTGDIAERVVAWLAERGGLLTAEDLADYAPIDREPVRIAYRGREVLTNPPPSAGGVLIAYALAQLERRPPPPGVTAIVEAMEAAQEERTEEFLAGLHEEGFLEAFIASRLGSTTHVAVLDADGGACSVTCSNGSSSGVVVPGTGLHLNNMLGEQDLNPLGFHRHPPGRRLPSMMAPTVVLRDGEPELVLGSAGSNRIRSAIVQTIVGVLDHGLAAAPAVDAPRVHFEDGNVYVEPGVPREELEAAGRRVVAFRDRNLFFGGVQAVERAPDGTLSGGGDPRRGGAVAFG